jgi:hypothetical protein
MAIVESATRFHVLDLSEDELHAIIEGLNCIAGVKLPEEREFYEKLAKSFIDQVGSRIFVSEDISPVALVPRCKERESGGYRCELPAGHSGNHACPKALANHQKGT